MATVLSFLNPIGGQLALRSIGGIFTSIATNGASYATASGGLACDFANILAAASQNGIPTGTNPIITIWGRTNDGYTAVFTYSATTVWNMRLYTSGGSEIGDGVVTKTVECVAFLAGGALS